MSLPWQFSPLNACTYELSVTRPHKFKLLSFYSMQLVAKHCSVLRNIVAILIRSYSMPFLLCVCNNSSLSLQRAYVGPTFLFQIHYLNVPMIAVWRKCRWQLALGCTITCWFFALFGTPSYVSFVILFWKTSFVNRINVSIFFSMFALSYLYVMQLNDCSERLSVLNFRMMKMVVDDFDALEYGYTDLCTPAWSKNVFPSN